MLISAQQVGRRWSASKRRNIEVLVLGLVCWTREDGLAASLTRNEIETIGSQIARTLDSEMLTDHDLDDTYFRMRILPAKNGRAAHNYRAYFKLVPETARPYVEEVQVGYYHNRLIVRYVLSDVQASLHTMRMFRDELTSTAVSQVFQPLSEAYDEPKDGLHLRAVRHTALQMVPRGTGLLRSELRRLRDTGYSNAYSVATTTFGVYINGSRLAPFGRRHYVRLSMSGATVYLAGNHGPDGLLIALVDAIYYGGLYEQASNGNAPGELMDPEAGPLERIGNEGVSPSPDAWSDNELLKVFALLRDSLRASEGSNSALRAAQVCAALAITSAIIGVIALFVR